MARRSCSQDHGTIEVSDAGALVDLNAASVALFEPITRGVGLQEARSKAVPAAIVDFRDADDDFQSGGAEAEQYRAAGLPLGPKNAPFETVVELDQVLTAQNALNCFRQNRLYRVIFLLRSKFTAVTSSVSDNLNNFGGT